MAEKIATRAAYGEALVALAEEYPELVVLDADLSGSTMTKGFAKAHPDRFYNMGIAEANMTGVAAGLAACGKKPFTNTFAMFAAGRAWEQVRNSIAYPRLNVKVVGSHGGLSVGEDGATHQCIEDYAIMRAIPNMMVVSPCDGPEMRQAVRALLDYDGPAYLRLGRLAVESVTDAIPGYTFHLGQGVTLRDGSDVTVIATGMMVQMALKAAEISIARRAVMPLIVCSRSGSSSITSSVSSPNFATSRSAVASPTPLIAPEASQEISSSSLCGIRRVTCSAVSCGP